jgi:hypothetical protein
MMPEIFHHFIGRSRQIPDSLKFDDDCIILIRFSELSINCPIIRLHVVVCPWEFGLL